MIFLLIDSSTPYLVVSIVEDGKIKYIYNNKIECDLSSKFMLIVEESFKKTGIKPVDIDKIFISTGPGSFTGIRISMTFAKIFAWSLKKDLIAFNTLELLASSSIDGDVVTLIDARRDFVYSGIFNSELEPIIKEQYINLNELRKNEKFINSNHFVSYDEIGDINIEFPKIDVLRIINKHINDIPINPNELKPSYLKKTEAEEKLKND